MLDLNFVRDNLPLVEEALRKRGMNPADVLKNFREIDARRRQAISEVEGLQARRNRASEEIARRKKEKQDADALIAETKELREKIQELEKAAGESEAELRGLLAAYPMFRTPACRWVRRRSKTSRFAAGGSRHNSIFAPSRTGNWASDWESWIWNALQN